MMTDETKTLTKNIPTILSNRIRLREITLDDATFILRLLEDPSFIENIGDKGVHTLEQAKQHIQANIHTSYQQHQFGLCLVERALDFKPMGICGLVKRDYLPVPDIGYAFLPEYCGQGYAFQAAQITLQDTRERLKLSQLKAITSPGNRASQKLLKKLGFKFEKLQALPGEQEEIMVFYLTLNP